MTNERDRIASKAPSAAVMVVFGLVMLGVAVFAGFSAYGKFVLAVPGLAFWTSGVGFFVMGEERTG